MSTMFNFMPNT